MQEAAQKLGTILQVGENLVWNEGGQKAVSPPGNQDSDRPTTTSSVSVPPPSTPVGREPIATPIIPPYDPYDDDKGPSRMGDTPLPPPRGLTTMKTEFEFRSQNSDLNGLPAPPDERPSYGDGPPSYDDAMSTGHGKEEEAEEDFVHPPPT